MDPICSSQYCTIEQYLGLSDSTLLTFSQLGLTVSTEVQRTDFILVQKKPDGIHMVLTLSFL